MATSTRGLDGGPPQQPGQPTPVLSRPQNTAVDGKHARDPIRRSDDLDSTLIWDLFLLRFNFISIYEDAGVCACKMELQACTTMFSSS